MWNMPFPTYLGWFVAPISTIIIVIYAVVEYKKYTMAQK